MRKLLIVWWTIWLVFFSAMPVGVVDAAPILVQQSEANCEYLDGAYGNITRVQIGRAHIAVTVTSTTYTNWTFVNTTHLRVGDLVQVYGRICDGALQRPFFIGKPRSIWIISDQPTNFTISDAFGGGGVDPKTGQMWVDVTAPNGGYLKGAQMANLLAYFRGKGFQPTSWRPTYDQSRGIWVMVFVTIKATGVPQIVCKWDAASNCLRRVDNWKPCSKQTICTERG